MSKLCVDKLCVVKLCVSKLCVRRRAGAGAERRRGGSAQPKTRTKKTKGLETTTQTKKQDDWRSSHFLRLIHHPFSRGYVNHGGKICLQSSLRHPKRPHVASRGSGDSLASFSRLMGRSGAVCENPTWHPKSWWILVALHIFTLQLPVKKRRF